MLLREAMIDPDLSQFLFLYMMMMIRYSVLIIDEAHERSLQTDILCSFIKYIQQRRNIHLIVMSATLQSSLFDRFYYPTNSSQYPNHIIQIQGRTFPVEI